MSFTSDMRSFDAVRSAVEPYAEELRGYCDSVTERAAKLVATLKRDPRFAKLFETADSLST